MSNYIETQDERELTIHATKLLDILQRIAPNGGEQQVLATIYNRGMADGGAREALRAMSNLLSDGMEYGNWIWVNSDGTVRTTIPAF